MQVDLFDRGFATFEMRLALFNLPVEILDQIFHDAISVRTCPRALRLRFVCRKSCPYSMNTNVINPPSPKLMEVYDFGASDALATLHTGGSY